MKHSPGSTLYFRPSDTCLECRRLGGPEIHGASVFRKGDRNVTPDMRAEGSREMVARTGRKECLHSPSTACIPESLSVPSRPSSESCQLFGIDVDWRIRKRYSKTKRANASKLSRRRHRHSPKLLGHVDKRGTTDLKVCYNVGSPGVEIVRPQATKTVACGGFAETKRAQHLNIGWYGGAHLREAIMGTPLMWDFMVATVATGEVSIVVILAKKVELYSLVRARIPL